MLHMAKSETVASSHTFATNCVAFPPRIINVLYIQGLFLHYTFNINW
jgi:hypothetical protein